MTPLTHTAAHARGNPHAYSFTGIIEGLKEICGLMMTGLQRACLDVEAIVQKTLEEATRLNHDFTVAAAQDLDKWATALRPVRIYAGVSDFDMEVRQRHNRQTSWEVSNQILSLPNPMVKGLPTQGELVRTTLLESFAVVNAWCSSSWKEVADWIPDIMARHVPAGQAQVFLNVVYQLLCTQYQANTTMVVAQTDPPVRSGMHNWAAQASLTRRLTQMVLALRSLEHSKPAIPSSGTRIAPQHQEEGITRAASTDMTVYLPIPPDGCVMVPKGQYPSSTVQGSSSLPIYLGNKTDSGISSVGHSTPVKSTGVKQQHLTSTPKLQPKLISVARQQTAKLSAKQQGAPHGAHMKHDREVSAQVNSWGDKLLGWSATCPNQADSLNSSIISIDDHTQLTTKHLMERDDPTQNCSTFSGGEEVMSVHDSSDIEMVSNVDPPECHSEDSALDSASDGKHSINDPVSGDHADSNPESNSGSSDSDSKPGGGSSSDSKGSNDSDQGNFGDIFSARKTNKPTTKKHESRAQSSSHSWSRKTESQKRAHTPSLENDQHPDKPELKKKKPTSGKSETPKGPSKATPKAVDKIAQEVGEDLVQKFQEEEDKQEHQSQSKKSKKDCDGKKEQEEEYRRQKKKKKKEKERKEREEREAKEAKRRAKQQQLEADKRMGRAKLIHTVRLEKYSEELPELQAYRRKYVTNPQRATVNLDSHIHYLEMIGQDKSLYPNCNIILGTRLIEQLW